MDFSIRLPCGNEILDHSNLARIVDLGRMAEDSGFDTLVIAEHVVMGKHVEQYEWGSFGYPIDAPFMDPLVVHAAIASVTTRIGLSTGIMVAPLRPAALLAKMSATLDVLSGGRLELGVGVGWQEAEFAAEGLDFALRGRLLTDTMAACRALWSSSPASFSSDTVSFEDIWCEPRPVQPGGPRILYSGTMNQFNLERITSTGDGWLPIMGATLEDVRAGVDRASAALRAAGRNPGRFKVRHRIPVVAGPGGTPCLAASLDALDGYPDAGVTEAAVSLATFVQTFDGAAAFFDAFATRRSMIPF